MRLMAADSVAALRRQGGAMQDEPKNDTATIMVVDDDQRNVRLMESILRSNGYRVTKAHDGEEAKLAIEAASPDLVLLDVMMPKMSGFELCRLLRGRYETRLLPVIMITALNSLEDKVRALETGADDFLSKPINKTELLAKVRSILRVKSLQDEVERQRIALENTNRQLLTMQQFKESVTQMVVHDLKNPLAGIMGNIQLMQLQKAEMTPERQDELLERTLESGRQMTRLILNILDVGKLEEQKMPLKLEAITFHDTVADNLNDTRSMCARDGIRIENRVDPGLRQVEADPGLLNRIVANLLNNAIKHTPEGGRVTVTAEIEGPDLVFSISDTGEGIPEDLQAHVFEKFVGGNGENLHRRLHDSGLGLAFCRLAVQHHRGRIWLRSYPGEGTTVYVALPLRRSEAAERAGGEAEVSSAGSRAA
jgi:signal transduction histidine kinase